MHHRARGSSLAEALHELPSAALPPQVIKRSSLKTQARRSSLKVRPRQEAAKGSWAATQPHSASRGSKQHRLPAATAGLVDAVAPLWTASGMAGACRSPRPVGRALLGHEWLQPCLHGSSCIGSRHFR